MMKKYNRPEIEALALETIDVIATSGNVAAQAALDEQLGGEGGGKTVDIEQQLSTFETTWSW